MASLDRDPPAATLSSRSELFRKYDVPGPRYTSYPTVPYWDATPTADAWIAGLAHALDGAARDGVGAALYVHIPFCLTLCTYCGCNTRIMKNSSGVAPYIAAVHREWATYGERLGRTVPIQELHLGGGTPNFLSPDELTTLLDGLTAHVRRLPGAEFSIEVDPRTSTRAHFERLARLGFRRLSLGIQDFDPRVQDIVHRIQSEEEVRAATDTAREFGFTSVNYDLIYGLPLQTRASVRATVEAVRRLRPDRIAFYAYAHVPWIKPGQRRFTEADLPSGDEKRALYELGRGLLEEVGYREIGMDHFALETDALWTAAQRREMHRNFMGYIPRHVTPMIGLGVSSIGDSWTAFAQNEKVLEAYQERATQGELPILRGHVLNAEDLVLRRHILDLMTRMETSWERPELRTPFLESVPARLAELARDGLVELTPASCRITEPGRAFLRNVCMAFDARLVRQAPSTPIFSKTI